MVGGIISNSFYKHFYNLFLLNWLWQTKKIGGKS